jgi:hypothetical protein
MPHVVDSLSVFALAALVLLTVAALAFDVGSLLGKVLR